MPKKKPARSLADLMPPLPPPPRNQRAKDTLPPSVGIPTSDIPAEQRRLEVDLIYGRPQAYEKLRDFDRSVKDMDIPKPAKDVRLRVEKKRTR